MNEVTVKLTHVLENAEVEMFLFFILQIMTFKSSHLDFEFTIDLCLFSLVSPPPLLLFCSPGH